MINDGSNMPSIPVSISTLTPRREVPAWSSQDWTWDFYSVSTLLLVRVPTQLLFKYRKASEVENLSTILFVHVFLHHLLIISICRRASVFLSASFLLSRVLSRSRILSVWLWIWSDSIDTCVHPIIAMTRMAMTSCSDVDPFKDKRKKAKTKTTCM